MIRNTKIIFYILLVNFIRKRFIAVAIKIWIIKGLENDIFFSHFLRILLVVKIEKIVKIGEITNIIGNKKFNFSSGMLSIKYLF